ncbi:hypothetical protein SOVF_049850 isoform B [Spinacia oleracea]|uniref:Uncharacterized protein At4g15545 isoform X1 n=1 Tax=Spinacia oleracea TaxID=3562 RepID=A0A9R0HVZ4_SPIOL|nr:uncharacterized protein At4g15545 isoform X1 [Spinacia oleracea]KNA20697.1 hypothetical protein SOVF_049850 isoform B [Spinacia oleracea]
MSQNGGAMEAPDFHLPDEVLAVIPTDPYDQLDLARKITSMAIASRVSNLESETTRLKQKVYDQDRLIFELEEKASRLQQVFQDADSRLKLVHDENMKLVQERDSLSATVKKLNRDLGKLETFKRQLMQSLNEDTSAEAVDIGTCDQSVPRAYPEKDDGANGHTRHYSYNGSAESRYSSDDTVKQTGQRFSLTPYQITPRLTPTGTPKVISTSGSPRSYSAVGSPQKNSGATTPTKMQYDGRTSLSSWYPSSQQSSAANSPPRVRALPSRTPRIDGKEFFRQARSRLSYEQFSAFLANIKQLNDHKQSREETLRKADEILGTDNKDLYLSFQGLLNRNVN